MKQLFGQYIKLTLIVSLLIYLLIPWESHSSGLHSKRDHDINHRDQLYVNSHINSKNTNSTSTAEVNTFQNFLATSKNTSRVKIILLWNRWYMWPDYRFGLGSQPFEDKCRTHSCLTTTNRSLLSEADIVVFFATLVWFAELPTRRGTEQIWVFMDCEPAAPTYGLMWNFGTNINLTITYRSDSTIHWPYGVYEPLLQSHVQPCDVLHEEVKNKTRLVAWMASRCGMNSNNIRMMYINHLSKYIPVDIFGKCGNHSCDKTNATNCLELIEHQYKFYLAFENSVCRDYVTEKAFRTLQYNVVPVVMGGANYSKILPPKSYIDVTDFASPRHLADYLKYLDTHIEEYMKYLEWKQNYSVRDVIPDSTGPFCELCELVHSEKPLMKTFNVSQWWEGDSCVRGWLPLMEYFHLR